LKSNSLLIKLIIYFLIISFIKYSKLTLFNSSIFENISEKGINQAVVFSFFNLLEYLINLLFLKLFLNNLINLDSVIIGNNRFFISFIKILFSSP